MGLTLARIAEQTGARLAGDPGAVVSGVQALDDAAPGDLSFANGARQRKQVENSHATAIFVPPDFPTLEDRNLLHVEQPRAALIQVMEALYPPVRGGAGIHPRAVIADDAEIASGVTIGPCAVIESGARIGPGCVIDAGVFIGKHVILGSDCHIETNVSLLAGSELGERVSVHAGSVIGADGFGYIWREDHHHKIPQVGRVIIGNDVEIGANSCIDRAMMGATRIGAGSKIDNQVQIGHNVVVGRHAILVSQVGVSGSTTIEDGAILAGQVGVADHLRIGARAVVGAAAGVTRDIKPGEKVWGMPARPMSRVLREQAALAKLPELLKQVRAQQKLIEELQQRLDRSAAKK